MYAASFGSDLLIIQRWTLILLKIGMCVCVCVCVCYDHDAFERDVLQFCR